eukprot:gb/GECG01001848.1/.p1 GENE.gb/GECG01001848.1/~~gb/GECG01001848.1/.p1  ORF type:complete len:342 (+),score=17.58 gb/GECG01001848.1/:1-1026(+)
MHWGRSGRRFTCSVCVDPAGTRSAESYPKRIFLVVSFSSIKMMLSAVANYNPPTDVEEPNPIDTTNTDGVADTATTEGTGTTITQCRKRPRLLPRKSTEHVLHTESRTYTDSRTQSDDDIELAIQMLQRLVETEGHGTCMPKADCLSSVQDNQLKPYWRKMVVDWMIDVVKGFNLNFETLCQATALLDRALSTIKIPRTLFQKLGLACIFVASKVNECCPIGMKSIKAYFQRICDVNTLRDLELRLVVHLDWTLSSPNVGLAVSLLATLMPNGLDVLPIARRLLRHVITRYESLRYAPTTLGLAALRLLCSNANMKRSYESLERTLESLSIHIKEVRCDVG